MESTTERTTRTTRGTSGMTMATITMPRPGRVRVMSAMASRIEGIAIRPSMIRMTMPSIRRK